MLFKGQYHRLDRYQEDVFAVLEKAREISRSDSEVRDFIKLYYLLYVFFLLADAFKDIAGAEQVSYYQWQNVADRRWPVLRLLELAGWLGWVKYFTTQGEETVGTFNSFLVVWVGMVFFMSLEKF